MSDEVNYCGMRVDPAKAAAWQARWAQQHRRRWYLVGGKYHPIEPPSRPAQNVSEMGEPASAAVIRALELQINGPPRDTERVPEKKTPGVPAEGISRI